MRRTVGAIFVVLAAIVLVWEAVEFFEFGEWRLIVFGEIAFRLFPEWLNVAQAVIQRYVSAWLWDPAIQTFLLWPAWPVLGGLGVAFWFFGRRRKL